MRGFRRMPLLLHLDVRVETALSVYAILYYSVRIDNDMIEISACVVYSLYVYLRSDLRLITLQDNTHCVLIPITGPWFAVCYAPPRHSENLLQEGAQATRDFAPLHERVEPGKTARLERAPSRLDLIESPLRLVERRPHAHASLRELSRTVEQHARPPARAAYLFGHRLVWERLALNLLLDAA